MCLLLFAYECHPHYPLLLLANRDEFYARPSSAASPWSASQTAHNQLVAGRDLEAGGTWLGIASGGRVAAVTNVREPLRPPPEKVLSRGEIPVAFLNDSASPQEFAANIDHPRYRGFNTLLFDFHSSPRLICAGNRHRPFAMTPGVHGISNGAADAPWPKVERGKAALAELVQQLRAEPSTGQPSLLNNRNFAGPALALLRDSQYAPPQQLPHTGVSAAMELALSPIFVKLAAAELPAAANSNPLNSPAGGYGTRASTLVAIDKYGRGRLWEQTYVNGHAIDPLRDFQLD